jgi:hypothetical protein
MLYSFLSQINKGLRRIDILRKSEIGLSQRGFGQKFREDNSRFPGSEAKVPQEIPDPAKQEKQAIFHIR